MRRLTTPDIFAAARAVMGCGLREELRKKIRDIAKGDGELSLDDIGIDTVLLAMEALTTKDAEKTVYEVLSGPFEMTAEEVEAMPLDEMLANLETLLHDPGARAFFKLLSGMISRKYST